MKCHKCSNLDLRQDVICNVCGEVVFFKEPVLKWTKEKPSETGFYWCKLDCDSDEPIIVKVVMENGLFEYALGCETDFRCADIYKWQGPIRPNNC